MYSALARVALEGAVTPRRRLAFLGYHLAHAITSDHVVAAKNDIDRAREGTDGGLLRGAADTWRLLRANVCLPCPEGVHEDEDGQWELAFTLRSTHLGPAATWRVEEERAAKTARDTVRTWACRGREQVRALALAQGVGP